jgi:hypothetical protein
MALATFRAELGPCDDDGRLFLNTSKIISVSANQEKTFQRELGDGDYDLRLEVINSGGWAWKAKARILVNGMELWVVDNTGGSGLYTGQVYNESKQFRIRNGLASD